MLLLLLLLLLLWVEDGAAGYLTRFTSSEMADLESRPLKEFQEEVGGGGGDGEAWRKKKGELTEVVFETS